MSSSKRSGRKKKKAAAKPNPKAASSQRGRSNSEKQKATNLVLVLTPIILSLVVLVVLIRSCQISEDDVRNSRTAFLAENRPILTLNPLPYEDKSFFKIRSKNKQMLIEVQYHVQNLGKQPATNISLPPGALIEGLPFEKDADISYKIPSQLALAPGDSFILTAYAKFTWETKSLEDFETIIEEMYKKGFSQQIGIEYSSSLEPTKKYRTMTDNKFSRYNCSYLKGDMT